MGFLFQRKMNWSKKEVIMKAFADDKKAKEDNEKFEDVKKELGIKNTK